MKLFNRKAERKPSVTQPQTISTGNGQEPDYQRMMRMMGGDAKGHALNKLLSSDPSNAIKSSNQNAFNLSVMDALANWESAENEEEILKLFLNGRITVDGPEIEGGYRINKMAEDFKMTLTYSDAFKAWTIMGFGGIASPPSTLKEGDKK